MKENLNYSIRLLKIIAWTTTQLKKSCWFCEILWKFMRYFPRVYKNTYFFYQGLISGNAAERLLNFPWKQWRYEKLRQDQYTDKSKSLPVTIKKSNLDHFGTNTKKNQIQAKNVALTQRSMNIARLGQITTIEILPYHLLNSVLLFDGDLPAKSQ